MSGEIDPACEKAALACPFCGGDHRAVLQPATRERFVVAIIDGPDPYRVYSFLQFNELAETDACSDGVHLTGLDFLVVIWDRETRTFVASDNPQVDEAVSEETDAQEILAALQAHLAQEGLLD